MTADYGPEQEAAGEIEPCRAPHAKDGACARLMADHTDECWTSCAWMAGDQFDREQAR